MKARFPVAMFLVLICILAAIAKPASDEAQYLSPGELAISRDGRWLYVVCEKSDELRTVDTQDNAVIKRIAVGHVPRGIALSSDGKNAYVANSWSDSVSVIDTDSLEVTGTLPTGFEPISAVPDGKGQMLYVANRLSNDISVVDLQTRKELKRLSAGHGSSYLAASSDGYVYGTHIYPKIGAHRAKPESEITVLDTSSRRVADRTPLPNVAGVFHIALSPDGKLGVVAQLRPKNLIPLAHVEHGWAFGDSITIFGEDVGGAVQVPIDEMDRYFALPYGAAIASDKSKIYVSTAGSDSVTVIDSTSLLKFAHTHTRPFVNDLSASANYVTRRISVGRNPRGIVLSPDAKRLYVANRMDDTISVIDTVSNQVVSTIDLGGTKNVTPLRRGEQLFNTASFSFQGQFGCANCHLDSTFDGLQWDLEPDGFGVDIVDNRSIEDLTGTQPFKWNGGNPDLPTECGPRTERYFYRSQSYNSDELADVVSYVYSLPYRPNRYRLSSGELTPAQERGKGIFERTKTKNGRAIPAANQCGYCHSGPKYTSRKSFDVGTGRPTDRSPLIDTPQLPNVLNSAPYLHDGSARSLEEIWTIHNPKDQHGVTNDLTKDELNDLIEYLRTL